MNKIQPYLFNALAAMLHEICVLEIAKFERPAREPDVERVSQKFRGVTLNLGTCEIRTETLDELILDTLLPRQYQTLRSKREGLAGHRV